MLAKPSSCNYLWSWAFKVITEVLPQNKPELRALFIFIVHVNLFVLSGSNGKSTFQQKVSHPYILLCGHSAYLQSASLIHVWVGICHTKDPSHRMGPSHCVSRSKVVVLMHWHDITANLDINTQLTIFGKWWWSWLCFSSTVRKIAMYSCLGATSIWHVDTVGP